MEKKYPQHFYSHCRPPLLLGSVFLFALCFASESVIVRELHLKFDINKHPTKYDHGLRFFPVRLDCWNWQNHSWDFARSLKHIILNSCKLPGRHRNSGSWVRIQESHDDTVVCSDFICIACFILCTHIFANMRQGRLVQKKTSLIHLYMNL
jgi:hypothetical protein